MVKKLILSEVFEFSSAFLSHFQLMPSWFKKKQKDQEHFWVLPADVHL